MIASFPSRLLAALASVAVAAAAASSPALARRASSQQPCAQASVVATPANRPAMMAAVVCLVNRQRTSRGLPALQVNERLDRSAQRWTSTMVTRDKFTHGTDFAARISAVGFDWASAGENIATGYPTPDTVVAAWMASLGHCRNILSPQFTFVGTGIVLHGIQPLHSGLATWTQDFGLPIGWRAPSRNFGPANGCPYVSA